MSSSSNWSKGAAFWPPLPPPTLPIVYDGVEEEQEEEEAVAVGNAPRGGNGDPRVGLAERACVCGRGPCEIRLRTERPHAGRCYYCCSSPLKCKFFLWCDEGVINQQQNYLKSLLESNYSGLKCLANSGEGTANNIQWQRPCEDSSKPDSHQHVSVQPLIRHSSRSPVASTTSIFEPQLIMSEPLKEKKLQELHSLDYQKVGSGETNVNPAYLGKHAAGESPEKPNLYRDVSDTRMHDHARFDILQGTTLKHQMTLSSPTKPYPSPVVVRNQVIRVCSSGGRSNASGRGRTPVDDQHPICKCRAGKCKILERKGRKYYACHIKKGFGACSHFQWVDEQPLQLLDASTSHIRIPEPADEINNTDQLVQIDRHIGSSKRALSFCATDDDELPIEIDDNGGIVLVSDPKSSLVSSSISTDGKVTGSPVTPKSVPKPGSCYKCGEAGHCPNECQWSPITTEGKVTGSPVTPKSVPKPGRCYKCGEAGHWANECRGSPVTPCFKCGKTGHWMKNCTI